jgi:hypothetical protein
MILFFVGLYSYAFEYERKDSCIVCAAAIKQMKLSKSMLLKDLIQSLCDDISLQLKKPSVVGEGVIKYIRFKDYILYGFIISLFTIISLYMGFLCFNTYTCISLCIYVLVNIHI